MSTTHHSPSCDCNACRRRAARPSKPLRPVESTLARSLPCVHEGAVVEWCTSCHSDRRHVRDCDVHERCTRGFVSDRVRSCDRCPDFEPAPPPPDGPPGPPHVR